MTFTVTATITLAIPNKLKANGQPANNAVWRNVILPAGSKFTYHAAAQWLMTLCAAHPNLIPI